jgi:hypothetical protein
MRRVAGALLAAVLLLGCRPAGHGAAPPGGVAPVTPRGTVILEPPRIEVGDTAELVLAAVTPPGWRAAPLPPLEAPEGLAILEVGPMRVEQEGPRWIHEARVRVRALRTGALTWPGLEVRFTRPDGSESSVPLPPRPVEVTALLPESGRPQSFFSYRIPDLARGRSPGWRLGLLVLAAAVAVVLFTAARRLGVAGPRPAAPAPPARVGDWNELQAAIDAAGDLAARDPLGAADLLSTAMRAHLAQRFGAPTRTATTEELAAEHPPFALTTRWTRLVAFLGRLDELRFTPPEAGAGPRPIQRALAEARSLARELAPPGGAP